MWTVVNYCRTKPVVVNYRWGQKRHLHVLLWSIWCQKSNFHIFLPSVVLRALILFWCQLVTRKLLIWRTKWLSRTVKIPLYPRKLTTVAFWIMTELPLTLPDFFKANIMENGTKKHYFSHWFKSNGHYLMLLYFIITYRLTWYKTKIAY